MSNCVSCGCYIPEGDMICKNCHIQNTCSMCGKDIEDGLDVCHQCEQADPIIFEKITHTKKKMSDKEFDSAKRGKYGRHYY